MIMPPEPRTGLPNRLVVSCDKLNPATEPGDAIDTQATEITRLCKTWLVSVMSKFIVAVHM